MYIDAIPSIEPRSSSRGILWFGTKCPKISLRSQRKRIWSRFSIGDAPVFTEVDDLDSVYRLILDLSDKDRSRQSDAVGAFPSADQARLRSGRTNAIRPYTNLDRRCHFSGRVEERQRAHLHVRLEPYGLDRDLHLQCGSGLGI